MLTLLGMPQGSEWIILLAIVVLLFGSAKLPQLVRSLGKSKKVWEEEVGSGRKSEAAGELTEGASQPPAQAPAPVQQPAQQPAQQPGQQPGQAPQNTQINGQTPGDTPSQSN
jgi:sec-independent protein translocase protein TatA